MVGDVSKYEDCQQIIVQTLTQYGKIDVLINNAGLASQTMIQDIDPSVFQSIFNVNVMGTVFMTKAALPALIETKGSVLFIGSVAGIHGIGGVFCILKL